MAACASAKYLVFKRLSGRFFILYAILYAILLTVGPKHFDMLSRIQTNLELLHRKVGTGVRGAGPTPTPYVRLYPPLSCNAPRP